MTDIKAKETVYNGYRFRSKLEAKWAVFFDKLCVSYQYEPEAFLCEDGSQYTPDFYLPDCFQGNSKRLMLEIKPAGWYRYENPETTRYLRRIASAMKEQANLSLFVGDPYDVVCGEWVEGNQALSPAWDNYQVLMYCPSCKVLKAEFYEGNYMYCPTCGGSCDRESAAFAAEYARQYRFKFIE